MVSIMEKVEKEIKIKRRKRYFCQLKQMFQFLGFFLICFFIIFFILFRMQIFSFLAFIFFSHNQPLFIISLSISNVVESLTSLQGKEK